MPCGRSRGPCVCSSGSAAPRFQGDVPGEAALCCLSGPPLPPNLASGQEPASQQLPPLSSVSLSEQSQQKEGIWRKREMVTDAPDHYSKPHGSALPQTITTVRMFVITPSVSH